MKFLKDLYPLVVITTVAGILLALTYRSLKPSLDMADKNEFERSLREVYSPFDRYEEKSVGGSLYYVLYTKDTPVAVVFRTSAVGYGGAVEVLTAITNGAVARVVVMSMASETPGLGTKAKDPKWLAQFLGRTGDMIPTSKAEFASKGCDAVSGATFSSLAVTRSIKKACELYTSVAQSMATTNASATVTE